MITLILNSIIIIATLLGVIAFARLRNHAVATLLRLEFASLSLYLFLFYLLRFAGAEIYSALIYLTLAACEGALGLSILVILIKHHGNDYFKSPHLTQC
jgi:NADH-ubiquinone oxidoreductase chain 4L